MDWRDPPSDQPSIAMRMSARRAPSAALLRWRKHPFEGTADMKWITREHAKVDRVACPWLIKKFVDQDAEFVFAPPDKVMTRPNGSVQFLTT